MRRTKCRLWAAAALVWALGAQAARAQLLADSARQWPEGSVRLSAYYEGSQSEDLNFEAGSGGTCQAQGGLRFACSQPGVVRGRGLGDAAVMKLGYQPGDMFQYFAAFGKGFYSLAALGASSENDFTGGSAGLLFGGGIKAVIIPDTIVTPAVAFEASAWRDEYSLSSVSTAAGSSGVADDLILARYQISAEVSHLFDAGRGIKIDPYAGVSWQRVQADLHDLTGGGHAGGQLDVVTPFVGARLPVGKSVSAFAEASFVGGYRYAAGLTASLR